MNTGIFGLVALTALLAAHVMADDGLRVELITSTRLNHREAGYYCKLAGGELAVPSSAEMQQKIVDAMQHLKVEHVTDRYQYFWLGLKEDVNNNLLNGQSYKNYHWTQPGEKTRREDCVGMQTGTKKWYDKMCPRPYWFVCSFPKGQSRRPVNIIIGKCFRPAGNDAETYATKDATDPVLCSAMCKKESKCQSFTYSARDNKCYLKSKKAILTKMALTISGNKADC